eukprot:CAMPEP_0170472868 /NCGR_PEP_ID=MMETSP0123-20130129/14851_1 /TAXON_ID=182087 /ORGANISM="Favella ehrenbergii, Strain Fehren 1" /LENGTH=151 /DNA_ID=CAMNT_0010741473 /DNA_START=175 /DNA_END=628 /DNA_ORIENTATION=-
MHGGPMPPPFPSRGGSDMQMPPASYGGGGNMRGGPPPFGGQAPPPRMVAPPSSTCTVVITRAGAPAEVMNLLAWVMVTAQATDVTSRVAVAMTDMAGVKAAAITIIATEMTRIAGVATMAVTIIMREKGATDAMRDVITRLPPVEATRATV